MRMREVFKNLYPRELSFTRFCQQQKIAVPLNIMPIENAYPTQFHQAGV